ncbi:hypothetical protein CLU79DRAFT_754926 [Phycomyces nitens]|nr:hypothetical protein CLU79DRAFT_754926 [Phycomyces nitens]
MIVGEIQINPASSSWSTFAEIPASYAYGAGGFHTMEPTPSPFTEDYPNLLLTPSASCFLCGLMYQSAPTKHINGDSPPPELELTMFSPLVEAADDSRPSSRPLVNRLDSIKLYTSSRPAKYAVALYEFQDWLREWKQWLCQKKYPWSVPQLFGYIKGNRIWKGIDSKETMQLWWYSSSDGGDAINKRASISLRIWDKRETGN